MLGKLQEASQYMAKFKRKQKEKSGGGRRSDSVGYDHFGYDGYRVVESHRSKNSADGSSKDCYEELREAIREGLAKQNLLTKSCNEGKAYFDSTKLDLSMAREFDTSDNSFEWSFEEKAKGPYVTAKLVGLADNHPKPSAFTLQKQLGNYKSLKPRMPQFSVDKASDSPRITLEELTQTVQFKGLVTSPPTDRSDHQKQLSKASDWKKNTRDDSPPIVIIKPLQVSGSQEEDCLKQKFISQEFDIKEIIRNLKMKEVVPSRTGNVPKGALDINELQRKLQGEISPLEILSQEHYIDASTRTDDGAIKLMEKLSSTKMKAFVQEKAKVQVKEVVQMKEVINDKADKVQRLAAKPKEGDIVKVIVSTSSKKPDTQSTVSQLKAITPSSLEYIPLTEPVCSSTWKKNAKPENLVSISPSKPLVETQLKNEAIQINARYNHEHDLAVIKLTTSEEVPAGDEIKNNTSGNLDYVNKIESHLRDSTSLVKQKRDCKSTDKINDQKASNVTRNLLFDNPLFINKVEELFYTNAHQPLASSRRDNIISADTTTPLLDCAKELLQNKSLLQSTKGAHQFTHVLTNKSKMFIFLDQLVCEVCNGIGDLKGYHKLNGETFAQDTLPKVLHMDLWCKGVVNGGWDLGWRSGFTADEVEEIIVNIEQEILNEIIVDTVADMMMS